MPKQVQAALVAFRSPVEVPIRTSLYYGLGVGPVLKLEDVPAVVPALNDGALLNKLLASAFDGFADFLKLSTVNITCSDQNLLNSH